jgi:hypothetical protein
MASRIGGLSYAADLTLDRVRHVLRPEVRADAWASFLAWLWPADRPVLARIMRLIWLPWWALSDLPSPMPVRRARVAKPATEIEHRLVSLLGRIRRRQMVDRFATLFFRGLALTCLIGAIWTIGTLLGGPALNATILTGIACVMVLVALIYAWLYRPGTREIAVMLDATFDLADRVTTAVDEIGKENTQDLKIGELQQIEATNTAAILMRRKVMRVHLPVREIVGATGLGLTLLALYLLNGTGGQVSALESGSVPAFVAAKDRLKPIAKETPTPDANGAGTQSVQDVQDKANVSEAAQKDLLALADALDDNPLTAPIADAIRAGDYSRAADELKAIAPQLDQLSPDLRAQIAESLDKAADGMTGENPDLQDATRKAADDLRGDGSANESVTDLADEVQQTGEKVATDQELAQEMNQAREAQSDSGGSRDSRPDEGDNSDQSGSQGEQQIAGDGGDAASGSNKADSGDGQQTQGSGSEGSSAGSDGSQSGEKNGDQSDQSSSSNSSQAAGGATNGGSSSQQSDDPSSGNGGTSSDGSKGQQGTDPNQPVDSGENTDSQAGNGAGSGDGKNTSESSDDASSTGKSRGEADPDVPDANVKDGGNTGSTSTDDTASSPSETITLSRSPDAPGYRSGGSASSSSGSGTGAAAGAGSVEQGDVGTAGPDSNRVPDAYKNIVEDYFSDGP